MAKPLVAMPPQLGVEAVDQEERQVSIKEWNQEQEVQAGVQRANLEENRERWQQLLPVHDIRKLVL